MKNVLGIMVLPFAMIYVIAGLIVWQVKIFASFFSKSEQS